MEGPKKAGQKRSAKSKRAAKSGARGGGKDQGAGSGSGSKSSTSGKGKGSGVSSETVPGETDVFVANGRISVCGANHAKVVSVIQKHSSSASSVLEIDLTDNSLTALPGLEKFTKLKSLVLDRNNLKDGLKLPKLPCLENLWLNDNSFQDVGALLSQVAKQCPKLTYLSLLKNPCCPNFLEESAGKDLTDYQRHRYFVLHTLPTLKFLDFSPVNAEELREAKRRGQFSAVAKPKSSAASENDGQDSEVSAAVEDDAPGVDPNAEHEARTYLGFNPYNYLGRESEGNRFIMNNDL